MLADGHYLLPVYHETGHDPESVGRRQHFAVPPVRPKARSLDARRSGSNREGEHPAGRRRGRDQYLVAYCRRGGDYDPKTIGYLVRAESRDGGLTWTEGKDSAFPNPNAAVDFLKLKSGDCSSSTTTA